MAKVVRTGLVAALVSLSVACGGGGGGYSPPPPPPPSPPVGPNAPPTFTSPMAVTTQENAVGVVYRATATDPENAALTYTMSGADAARFTMNATTHEVRFTQQPDFEAPADAGANNVYDLSFSVSDGTNSVSQNVTVTVTNVANGFHVRRIASGMSAPIFATGLPDGSGRVVIVERAGRIRVINPATGVFEANDFLNITSQIDTNGEKGLLSIAFSPNFVVDRTFYLHMNPSASNISEIRKYQVTAANLAVADTTTADTILTVPQPSATNHKGGTLMFDNAGRLLISLGDGGSTPETAQDANNLRGKILRIDPSTDAFPADASRDYAIPPSNPFATSGGAPEVFAMGLRNPFRMSFDRVTGDLFIGDVGQSTIEEVDRVPASQSGIINFGWAQREGSLSYLGGADSAAFTLPVTEYGRSVGTTVTGGVVYRGPIEDLQGQYIFADFGSNAQWSVPIASLVIGSVLPSTSLTSRNTAFAPNTGTVDSIVNFGTDNAGNVYFVDIGGEVFVLEP